MRCCIGNFYFVDIFSLMVEKQVVKNCIFERNRRIYSTYCLWLRVYAGFLETSNIKKVINMYHAFSIAETIRTAWNVLKKNFVPLVVYSAISLFINGLVDFFNAFIFVGDDKISQFSTIIIQMIIQAYLALSFYKLILTLMDKEYYEFEFRDIVPSFKMAFNFIVIAFAYAVLISVLLFVNVLIERYIAYNDVILAIFRIAECCLVLYLLLRSIFCVCFIVDDDSSPIESLKQSFNATKDNFFKTLVMFLIVLGFMISVLIPIFLIVQLLGLDEDNGAYVIKLMYYFWFILTFPAVQVLIMVTYRKLVYSHLDVDDDISETI